MRKEYDFRKAKRGAVIKKPTKHRITMYLDDDVLAAFRDRAEESGTGYQTLINRALRDYLSRSSRPVDAKTLRRILREELG
jgi:uncharacterized protein (DUF4415 family)